MEYNLCKVIAEIGCVHLGSLQRAKELCSLAKLAGADYVKTQKRNPEESTPKHLQSAPHPNPHFAYGSTYLEHRKNLELSIEDHIKLQEYCNQICITYTSSVWDITSAREIISLNPPFIKVPSACNNHYDMLKILFEEYAGKIHISTGMTNFSEMNAIKDLCKTYGNKRVVIYHCTSAYPCPFENLYLQEITKLRNEFDCEIGFSNHGKGISADIASYILGATWIERHFVDDRTLRHTDAASSLEPDGLRRLCRDLNAVYRAMRNKPGHMDDFELEQRNKLKFKQ